MMVRWMCGDSLKYRVANVEFYHRLGVESISDVVRRGRLRWFGHLECKKADDRVSACRNIEALAPERKKRSKKTWEECVRNDTDLLGLKGEWEQDRARWKGLMCGNRPTRACME